MSVRSNKPLTSLSQSVSRLPLHSVLAIGTLTEGDRQKAIDYGKNQALRRVVQFYAPDDLEYTQQLEEPANLDAFRSEYDYSYNAELRRLEEEMTRFYSEVPEELEEAPEEDWRLGLGTKEPPREWSLQWPVYRGDIGALKNDVCAARAAPRL